MLRRGHQTDACFTFTVQHGTENVMLTRLLNIIIINLLEMIMCKRGTCWKLISVRYGGDNKWLRRGQV